MIENKINEHSFVAYKHSGSNINAIDIHTKCDFFKDPVIVNIFEDRIQFTKPNIDYNYKLMKFNKRKGIYHTIISHILDKMPAGEYVFDKEESNEDQIVIYFNQE